MGDMKSHFTGYLQAALKYERSAYFNKKQEWAGRVVLDEMIDERESEEFEEQLLEYLEERGRKGVGEWKKSIQDEDLVRRLERLKEKEQDIVFRRTFLGHSFARIGEAWQMTEKQAQQAYYYAIRKMRRQDNEL